MRIVSVSDLGQSLPQELGFHQQTLFMKCSRQRLQNTTAFYKESLLFLRAAFCGFWDIENYP